MRLYYCRPAEFWEQTLPIGNGSLGGMVWGTVPEETIGLNEESLWSGYERDTSNPGALACLEACRRLIMEGKYTEADRMIREHMLGEYNECYLPLGNVQIGFSHNGPPEDYARGLELDSALAWVRYRSGGIEYRREYLASYPGKALYIRLQSSEKTEEIRLRLKTELPCRAEPAPQGMDYAMRCFEHVDPPYVRENKEPIIVGERGRRFTTRLRVLRTDGAVRTEGDTLIVEGSSELVLVFSAVQHPETYGDYDTARAEHIADYRALFDRVELDLGEQPDMPTDERLARLRDGGEDPALYALYFQYGRYLLISSSREGGLPATLQGIWNWQVRPPWSSNWTVNINTQMNYWPAQSCHLEECARPYLALLQKVRENGRKIAETHFGCRGFCAGHNLDAWCACNPVGVPFSQIIGQPAAELWGFFTMSGAWMCQELWKQYEYHPDATFLENEVYPTLREAVLFMLDWLVEYEGYWVTCPSVSPENRFLSPENGQPAAVSVAATMDMTIIREVFKNFRECCRLLGREDECLTRIDEVEPKLYPYQTGRYGQLQEWFRDFDEREPGHRHFSHLYGLFPGELFAHDEPLKEACRRALERRMKNGSGMTGWSCAWALNLYTVLGDGEKAYETLQKLLKNSTYDNLWDAHPPFQIDGNFGGTAGIANMLVQDRDGEVILLPALPRAWKKGRVRGLCLKNGKKADLVWENGQLKDSRIYE